MITSIALRNFKTFNKIVVPLRPLTILSGINGSGKSTLLQSIGALKQTFEAGCLTNKGGLLLNGEYVNLGTGKDVLCEYFDIAEIGISVTAGENTNVWNFRYAENDDLLQTIAESTDEFVPPPWLLSGFQFLRADRIGPAVVYPKSFNDTVRRKSLGVLGQFTPHFLSINQDKVISGRRMRSEDGSPRLLDQVNHWLGSISPGVSVSASEIGGADLAQLLYRYGGSAGIDSSNAYRPTNVGFGLTYALPIIVACLAAEPNDLLLIENPEAHLHPRGQSQMGELLARASADGIQVLAETHSDHLLNGIRLAVKRGTVEANLVQLHFCTRKADGRECSKVLSPEMDSNGRLNDWPEGFFDEWERSLLELV